MSTNERIEAAISGLIDNDHVWAMSKPTEEQPDEWCVYEPVLFNGADFGDNQISQWKSDMRLHWFCKGHVNYISKRKAFVNALKAADLEPYDIYHDFEESTGITHLAFTFEVMEEM